MIARETPLRIALVRAGDAFRAQIEGGLIALSLSFSYNKGQLSEGMLEKMKKILLRSGQLFIACFSAVCIASFAFLPSMSFSAESADDLLGMIQGKYSTLRSFTADFTQSFASRALRNSFEESGRLVIKIPGQMRWDYEKPEEKVAICNGTDSWLYVKEDNTVIKGNIDDSYASKALLSLLTGMADLKEFFEGEIISRDEKEITANVRLRKENDQFDHLIVTVNRKSKAVVKIEIFDPLGNTMTYSFSNIQENTKVDPDIFRFSIPQGARIKFE